MAQQVGDIKVFPNGAKGKWDGNGYVKVDEPTPAQAPQVAGGMLAPSGKNPSAGMASFTPDQVLKAITQILTTGSQFIPGTGPSSMALRTMLYGMGSGAEGAIDGGLEGAKTGAENGLMLGAAGEGAGKVIPPVMDGLALALGGARSPVKAAWAYMRENANRGPLNKLAVGNQQGAEATASKVGETLRGVEKANPGTVPTSDFKGSTSEFQKELRVDRSGVKMRRATQKAENAFVRDKTSLYGPDLNMSDVGELYRARQQDARSLITKRRDKLPISPKDEQMGKIDSALAERGKHLYNKLDTTGEAKPLNSRLSDLHLVRDENRKMGNNAHVMAPLAMIGRRAAAGAMLGGATAYGTGSPVAEGTTMGALAGPVGLAPSNISRLGMVLGRTGSSIPAILSGKELLENPALQTILDELMKRSGQ